MTSDPDAGFDALFAKLSNWGRWGVEDQRGTLNLITPDTVRSAAGLVRTGRRVSCARPLKVGASETTFQHHMLTSGHEVPEKGMGSTADWFALGVHGLTSTHLNSPAHITWDGRLYNGIPASQCSTSRGALACSVDLAVDGIVGRGVLIDGPTIKGRPWLEPGETLDRLEVESWLEHAGADPASGDIVVVRFGRDEAERHRSPMQVGATPGLTVSCAEWLHERDIAVLVSDVISDCTPSPVAACSLPVHALTIAAMGMWLVDNAELGALAEQCQALDRWSFFFTINPLNLRRATGSPVTPVAIF